MVAEGEVVGVGGGGGGKVSEPQALPQAHFAHGTHQQCMQKCELSVCLNHCVCVCVCV